MKFVIMPDYDQMSRAAADAIVEQLIDKPDSVLGLATGSTPIGMYASLVSDVEAGKVSFADVSTFNLDEYLGLETLKVIVRQPLVLTDTIDKFDVIVNVHGGGFTGQAGAIRHGISRALLQADADYRPALKKAGFLTRDPRMKERKKYGLKAARRAPQFSKR